MKLESMSRIENFHTPQVPSNRLIGWVVGAFFLLFAIAWGFADIRSGHFNRVSISLIAIAVILVLLAEIKSIALAPLNLVWMGFARGLHSVISPITLAIVFFGVLTPTAVLRRKQSKDRIPLDFDPEATTYWTPRVPPGPEAQSLKRQF